MADWRGSLILRLTLALMFLFGVGLSLRPAQALGELKTYSAENLETCRPDTDGMISYWPLDDGPGATTFEDVAGDGFGYDNTGSCTGTNCPASTIGKVKTAFDFNNDMVNVADAPEFNFLGTDSFSFEMWIKTGQDCAGNKVFIGKYGGPAGSSWWVGCSAGNTAAFSLRDPHDQVLLVGTTVINDNGWHHIVAMRDESNDENRLYVDGVLDSLPQQKNYTGTFASEDAPVTIGHFNNGNYRYTGILDEVAVYGKALSEGEIQAHYSNGMGQSYCQEAPQIINPGAQTNDEGDTNIALQIQASGDFGSSLTYSATGLPPGLSIAAGSGLITGSLDFEAAAESPYSAKVTVTNDADPPQSNFVTFSWVVNNVNRAPSIENPGAQNSAEGSVINLPISASDPDGDGLTFSASNLPDGLGINPSSGWISGTISQTAAQDSPYAVTVTVTDGTAPAVQATFNWTVSPVNVPPVLEQPEDQLHSEGEAVLLQLLAHDPDGDGLAFSASNLPDGLGINPSSGWISGTISQTAAQGSPYAVTVTVTDGTAPAVQATFNWTINSPPQVTNPGDQHSYENEVVSLPIQAQDEDGDALVYSADGLPAGLSINSTTGVISGKIQSGAAGSYDVTLAVSDGLWDVAIEFAWEVSPAPFNYLPIVINKGGG